MSKILVIEDDENIRMLIGYDLMKANIQIDEAEDGNIGLQMALHNGPYDLILVDWMLPAMSGIDLMKKLRSDGIDSILFMMTAKSDEQSLVDAFEAGADDFIYKPFRLKELHYRIASHLRLHQKQEKNEISFGDIVLNTSKRIVTIQNKPISLTKKEFDFLEYFIKNSNVVLSRDTILNDLWGFDYDDDTRIVDVHIYKLRNKLVNSNVTINSCRGVGYIFEQKEKESDLLSSFHS